MAICNTSHICEQCERAFFPKRTDRRRFCGRACAHAAQQSGKALRAFPNRKPVLVHRCVTCNEIAARKSIRYCDKCRPPAYVRREKVTKSCTDCGVVIVGTLARTICKSCAKRRTRARQIASGYRAANRSARKLRLRCVTVESVNPLVVLRRDKWKCQLCGKKTSPTLRGSYADAAPEVDHIVPIAMGGEHSYRNVQCACRKCNLAKSASPKGQMRLFG